MRRISGICGCSFLELEIVLYLLRFYEKVVDGGYFFEVLGYHFGEVGAVEGVEIAAGGEEIDVLAVEPETVFRGLVGIAVTLVHGAAHCKDFLGIKGGSCFFKDGVAAYYQLAHGGHGGGGGAVIAAAVVETGGGDAEIVFGVGFDYVFPFSAKAVPHIITEDGFAFGVAGVTVDAGQALGVADELRVYFQHGGGELFHELFERGFYVLLEVGAVGVEPVLAVVGVVFKDEFESFG